MKINQPEISVLKNYFLLICFTLIAFSSTSQTKRVNGTDKDFPTEIAFPKAYYGEYGGNVRVSNATGVLQNVPIEFTFATGENENTSKYTLSFILGKGKTQTQSFTIIPKDIDQGLYLIEGSDGSVFIGNLIDNVLYSTFEMNENIMMTEIEFNNNGKIRLKITRATKLPKSKEKRNKDIAYPAEITLVQKAVLSKIN
jgi:hypothetical protein